MTLQIGANHMIAQIPPDRVRRARLLRPSAVQVILADWFPLREAEMVACLEWFAAATEPTGLVPHNPCHAKVALMPVQIDRLRAIMPALVASR